MNFPTQTRNAIRRLSTAARIQRLRLCADAVADHTTGAANISAAFTHAGSAHNLRVDTFVLWDTLHVLRATTNGFGFAWTPGLEREQRCMSLLMLAEVLELGLLAD